MDEELIKTKKSFIVYANALKVLDELTDEQAGKLFKAIKLYQEEGKIELEGLLKAVFIPFKTMFDENNATYENVCKRNKENGLKGGRPKTETQKNPKNPVGFSETQTNPKNLDNDNDNDNDNENVITQKENKEKVVCEQKENLKNSSFYASYPHPDLMFDPDVNKIFDIYKDNCKNLIPIGFAFRDLRKRQKIKEFLNVISGDFDYFKRVCAKANKLKVIAGNKLDIDSVINNHNGIINDKYQVSEEPIDFRAMAQKIADKLERDNTT